MVIYLKNEIKINIDTLKEFTGNKFPRGFGNPYRCNSFGEYYIVNSMEDLIEYIKQFDNINIYTTVYSFEDYTQENRDSNTVFIDVIPFDFDDSEHPENALHEVKKLVRWAKKQELSIRVHYSGSKGFHAYLDIDSVDLKHPKDTLKYFINEMQKSAQFKTLDVPIVGDLERIIRIPNSVHGKTGRYCIPLDTELLPYYTMTDILIMSQQPSDYVPVRKSNPIVAEKLKEYDQIVDKLKEEQERARTARLVYNDNNPLQNLTNNNPFVCAAYESCIVTGAKMGTRDYYVCGLAHYYREKELSFEDTLKSVYEFADKCTPKLDHQYVYDRVKRHYYKKYSHCTFFLKVDPLCETCIRRKCGKNV